MLASRLPKPSPHRVAVAGKRFGPRACRLAAFRSAVVRSILPRPVPKWGCLRPKGTAQIDRDRRARLLTIRASLVMPRLKRRRSPRTKPSHDGSFNPPRTIGSPAGAMERLAPTSADAAVLEKSTVRLWPRPKNFLMLVADRHRAMRT